jgi:hypothetical protein
MAQKTTVKKLLFDMDGTLLGERFVLFQTRTGTAQVDVELRVEGWGRGGWAERLPTRTEKDRRGAAADIQTLLQRCLLHGNTLPRNTT